MSANCPVQGSGQNHLCWMLNSTVVPPSQLWNMHWWPLLHTLPLSHREASLPLLWWRGLLQKRHVDPALQLQYKLPYTQRALQPFSQPPQRHPYLQALRLTHHTQPWPDTVGKDSPLQSRPPPCVSAGWAAATLSLTRQYTRLHFKLPATMTSFCPHYRCVTSLAPGQHRGQHTAVCC